MSASEPNRRQQVLDALREAPEPITLAAIADRLGVHANTVRFHADRLVEAGQAVQVDVAPSGPGRPAAHFRATRRMDPTGPRQYQALAEVLVDALGRAPDRRERARAAGLGWGAQLAHERPATGPAADRLTALLDEVGFAPEHDRGSDDIALRHCPFLELALDRTDVVCPIHLGLMQGALAAWGDKDGVRLQPFLEPDLCLAHLERTAT